MMAHKRLCGRGGARREKVELDIDDGVLLDCFGKHHALISNLGIYETKSTKDQPDGKGLLYLEPLLADIKAIKASCNLPIPLVRKALSRLVFQQPTVNKTIYNNALWGGLRQERITCVCNHFRRLSREDDRLRQVALKLNSKELLSLKELLTGVEAGGAYEPSVDCHDSDQETVFVNDGAMKEEKRELKHNLSEVSVDSDGFPKMFGSPKKGPMGAASPQAAASPQSSKRRAASELQQAMQGDKAKEGSVSKKTRGGSSASTGAGAAATAAAVPPAAKRYTKMYYKGPNSFGLRQLFGEKHQVVSVCRKGCTKSDLELVADRALERLHNGGSEADVKAWVQARVAQL